MFSSGPRYPKISTNLRLSINRLKLLEKKKTELAIKARKEISEYLANGKVDRARIRVEHIIREDYMVEGMEIIELYCDLLLARIGLIKSQKDLDEGLEKAVASIIWASVRLVGDVPELKIVSDEFSKKYSKEFAIACRTNQLENVDEKVLHKLGVQAPSNSLVESYLEEIAKTYNVPFVPDPALTEPDEIMRAEGVLIDFNKGSNRMADISFPSIPMPQPSYPPPDMMNGIDGQKMPPPAIPGTGPVGPNNMEFGASGGVGYPPGPGYPPAPGFVTPGYYDPNLPQPPSYTSIDKHPTPKSTPKTSPTFPDIPELPNVPTGTFSTNSNTKSDDVDFDDITRRFEELKRKK